MNILKQINDFALHYPERSAFVNGEQVLTYGDLWEYSERLADWLLQHNPVPGEPIAVYGHKNPWMLVCFLACVKTGCAYCPIDISVPDARVTSIFETLTSKVIFTTEKMMAEAPDKQVYDLDMLQEIVNQSESAEVSQQNWVSGDHTYYIIFTSGSTGTPKGVQISADCLNHYLDWSIGLSGCSADALTYLNQAPFSFDLSVMDLYTCLATGGTLYCLEKSVQGDYRRLMQSLRESQANVWVSTPSFAEVCLSEPAFSAEMMPNLRAFLFCGETLGNRTVKKLQERFPEARIVNTYGPTESTVAVTDVWVTPQINETINPLPVGRAKPGTRIEIRDTEGKVLAEGEKGEIIILGDTVSTGYYRAPELTAKAFFTENGVRGYHTGDKGYLEDGLLYYCGRIDLQIKLHGYRMELEDIENNIRKLPQIEHVVVVPNSRGGKVSSLTAFLVEHEMPEDEKAETAAVKEQLSAFLPDYMIPKKIVFLESMPMTNNGKADRKLLGGKQ